MVNVGSRGSPVPPFRGGDGTVRPDVGSEPLGLPDVVETTLGRLTAMGGEVARLHFHAATDCAADFGDVVVVQHLRNRLLAYCMPRSFARQPPAGLSLTMRGQVLSQVEALETALSRSLSSMFNDDHRASQGGGARVLILLDHLPASGRIYSHTRQVCAYAAALVLDPTVAAVGILASQETAPENPFEAVEVESADASGWRRELADLASIPRAISPSSRPRGEDRSGPIAPASTG